MELALLGSFFGMTIIGVPVAFSLALSVALVLFGFMDMPLVMISQNMYSGIDSFSFMAVPFFHAGRRLYVGWWCHHTSG